MAMMSFSKQLAAAKSERKVLANCEAALVSFEELPEYLKDNEFIRNYYRCEWPLKEVALSVFSCHNETINIWTHLIGFFIFSKMLIMSLTQKTSLRNVMETFFGDGSDGWLSIMIEKSISARPLLTVSSLSLSRSLSLVSYLSWYVQDSYVGQLGRLQRLHANELYTDSISIWPWFVFLAGAMSCLIFSSISHLFGCHSRRFHYFFWRLDYTGISLMIVCSFFTPIYYIFPDHPYWRFFYLSSVTLIGAAVVVTLLAPSLTTVRSRSFRATLFLCMGFSGVVPATHAVILHWDQPQIVMSLVYELAMGLLYGVGAVIYVGRIPERWKPGAFDIVGHSHQIFHVLVVAAALAHCAATLMIMEWRRGLPA